MLMRVSDKGQRSVVIGCLSCAIILSIFSFVIYTYEPRKGDWDLTNDETMIR